MMVDIKEYPGYKINENGIVINKKGHVMRPGMSNVGRLRVALETYDENGKLIKRTNESTYRLVAKAFLPNPDNLPIVMHLDNDPLHCHVSNLKWGTASENIKQAFDEGRKKAPNLTHDKCIYEVYNDDRSNVIKCKGRKGVCDLVGFTSTGSIDNSNIIRSGPYKGYHIKNTKIRCKSPVIFDKNNTN